MQLIKIYRALFTLLSPFIRLYFRIRCSKGKDKIECVKNHFGEATVERPEGKLLWIHAASIGESKSALTYIKHIRKHFPDLNILLTTITVTSEELLKPEIEKISRCFHQFVVADNLAWIKTFLDYWKVDVAVILESEIWPNIMFELHDRAIPVFLLNARLSERSFNRWNRWSLTRTFFTEILQKFSCILAQSQIDYERFATFSPSNTRIIDNLKYLNEPLPCDNRLLNLFEALCRDEKDRIVFVAASTHEQEEEIILDAHVKLKEKFNIITIIIPRHIDRAKQICGIAKAKGCSCVLRSQLQGVFLKSDVYCIDSFGEVGTFFKLADICFVGGSLVPIGGHNIYEPVMFGKPVLHGPYMFNALEVKNYLASKGVAFEVKNSDEICFMFQTLIPDLKVIEQRATSTAKNESLKQIDEIIQLDKLLSRAIVPVVEKKNELIEVKSSNNEGGNAG